METKNLESVFMISVLTVGNENVFIVRDKTTQVVSTTSDSSLLGELLLNSHLKIDKTIADEQLPPNMK